MPTLAQIQQAVDTQLAQLWTTVQNREATYASNHGGHYWQGLRTHTIDPADGNLALPDVGQNCPSDQQGQPWPNAILTTQMEMSLQIDVYDGPLGVGYVGTVRVTVNGNTYERSAQVGPETWRTHGWQKVIPL